MKPITKIVVTGLLCSGVAMAQSPFLHYGDMCEKTATQVCPNYTGEVANLQRALNANKKIDATLDVDGKWGKNTQKAVIALQEAYHISPTKGYVGSKTKHLLAKVTKGMHFKKVASHKRSHAVQKHYSCYADFKKHVNLKRSYQVFKDPKLLAKANRHNTHIKIDVSQQRLNLLVNGKVALCSPCTTGAKHKFEPNTRIYRDKHTPLGTYRIKEKIANKRSTIFCDLYRNGKKIYHGDRRKYRGSWKGVKYVGASLKNWMRLTSGGIGLHASKYVKRYPGTNGCIRLPYSVAKTVFSKVKKGTKVTIVN